MPNAFWTGTSTFFGQGYAVVYDAVADWMTDGWIGRSSSHLFDFHQSGAINELLADVMASFLNHPDPFCFGRRGRLAGWVRTFPAAPP